MTDPSQDGFAVLLNLLGQARQETEAFLCQSGRPWRLAGAAIRRRVMIERPAIRQAMLSAISQIASAGSGHDVIRIMAEVADCLTATFHQPDAAQMARISAAFIKLKELQDACQRSLP